MPKEKKAKKVAKSPAATEPYDYKVITYYTKEEYIDGDWEDDESAIGGDYSWIELRDFDGNLIVWYGDYYHDGGSEKIEGFLDALKYMTKRELKIESESVATKEWQPNDGEYNEN